MATIFGKALTALGAVPVAAAWSRSRKPDGRHARRDSRLLISGIVLLAGSRHLPREMALMLAKLRAIPSRRLAVTCSPA